MKVTKHGTEYEQAKKEWPVGAKGTCSHCGCEFQIEAGDGVPAIRRTHPAPVVFCSVTCPECRRACRLEKT